MVVGRAGLWAAQMVYSSAVPLVAWRGLLLVEQLAGSTVALTALYSAGQMVELMVVSLVPQTAVWLVDP